jgi:hypothetical protein
MNQDQVYLALGSPVCKKDVDDEGRMVTVWLYPPIGRDACVTSAFRVYFEEGVVTTWDRFTTPHPIYRSGRRHAGLLAGG